MSGSFHRGGDTDRVYTPRSQRGKGLRSIEDLYEIRMTDKLEH